MCHGRGADGSACGGDRLAGHPPIVILDRCPVEPSALAVPCGHARQHGNQRQRGELGIGDLKDALSLTALQDRLELIFIVAAQPLDNRKIGRVEVAQLHIGDEHQIGPVEVVADVVAHEAFELPLGRGIGGRPIGQQILEVVAHQIEEQRLLVGGVEVKRARLHPDLRRDLAHRHGGKAMAREKPQRGLPQTRPGDLGVAALFACHGVRLSERVFNSTGMDRPALQTVALGT